MTVAVLLQRALLGDAGLLAEAGKASNSPMMAITGPCSPASPITAVGMPATPLLTLKPCCSSIAAWAADERVS